MDKMEDSDADDMRDCVVWRAGGRGAAGPK